MRKELLLLIFLFQGSLSFSIEVAELRKLYVEAAKERKSADRFLVIMDKLEVSGNPILLSYKAMAHFMQANHSLNPIVKLSSFSKGRDMLEKAVLADPKNVEIRFMRYCVQTNAPTFLGYCGDVNKDRDFMLNAWAQITDANLKEWIREHMVESPLLGANEKKLLR